jgi:hypothetical protein
MISNTLTDYYLMQEIKLIKSHRFDCIKSTGSYSPFETIANRGKDKVKRFFFYLVNVPEHFNAVAKRKAHLAITNGKNNISSVYTPDLDNPLLGYGDTAHTNDALLFVFSEDYKQIEVFVARNHKYTQMQLCQKLANGSLDEEIAELRAKAKATGIL